MKYSIVEKGPLWVVGIEVRTDNAHAAETIPPLWDRFYLEGIPQKLSGDMVGLYTDYEGDYTKPYTLVAGCVASTPLTPTEGMVIKEVPKAKFAKIVVEGSFPQSLMDAWEWVWEDNIERSYQNDFELYPGGFSPDSGAPMELYIEVQ